MASILCERDDQGTFALDRATSYCAEDEYTRLARDIVLFTVSDKPKFLVRTWGGGGHRAQASHGNAFGTFFYRPPKNAPANENDVKFAIPMWETQVKGWLLTFAIDGLGPKNRELAAVFGPEAKEALLASALTTPARCYVIPSSAQSSKSSIPAPMTALVSFLSSDEVSLAEHPALAWVEMEQALDPAVNVHAGVIAHYCLENGLASPELLAPYGWTDAEMYVAVQLPESLSTVQAWGTDLGSIYTSMKNLLLQNSRLHTPLPPRHCQPGSAPSPPPAAPP